MNKTISDKINSLFKYRYQSAPETVAIYEVVQLLIRGKYVDKQELLETIKNYIFHNEAEMKNIIKISVLTHVNAEGTRKMLEYWEKINHGNMLNDEEIKHMDAKIKKMEDQLKSVRW